MGKNARIPGQATEHKLKRGRRKLLESGHAQEFMNFTIPMISRGFFNGLFIKKTSFAWLALQGETS